MLNLSQANLSKIAELGIKVPTYDRSEITPGIIHFGVGGFHRAHQAMYLDRLMNNGEAKDWGIVGMGVMPGDAKMRDALAGQDYLYTLTTKAPDGTHDQRVIGSIVDYIFAPDDPSSAVARIADPQIRIVSLTVTEGGYGRTPQVEKDIADLRAGRTHQLRTFYGLIAAALQARHASGEVPFTVMSCDNIEGNGEKAHASFVAFATEINPEFGQWVHENVPFPNSMVDRITPVTTDDDRKDVAESGYTDAWPVVSEDFTQWVLQEHFAAGRPPYEKVGVQVVEDVVPYELMKLRLLNASHQGLCYFGHLAGYTMVHDVMADPLFPHFLLRYMEEEGTPTLRPLPDVDLPAYRAELIARFGNSAVKDTVARLCAESSDRIPKWLLPVVRENLEAGRQVELSAAIVASWARYAEGLDEKGEPIKVVDALADQLMEAASHNKEDNLAFLRDRELFGDLVDEPRFTEPYVKVLNSLHEVGSRATLEALG